MKNKAFLVDDESLSLFLMTGILKNEGIEAYGTTNPFEAMEKIKIIKPDVILLDIMMPEMTGTTLLTLLKSDKSVSSIPVVIVSAKTDSEGIKECLELGAVDFVKKPIDDVELVARVNTAIRIKKKEEQLTKLLEIRNDVIKIISHDLKSPLGGLVSLLSLLTEDYDGELEEDVLDILNSMKITSVNLFDYVEKLMNKIFLESGEIIVEKKATKLKELVQNIEQNMRSKLKEKEIEFVISIDEEFTIFADDVLFSQVLINLIGNSLKFTRKKGKIEIKAEFSGNIKIISVADNGIGTENQNLFGSENMDMTVSMGTNGEHGTGFGLKIIKRIIESHGFEIYYESRVGNGTKFFILMKE